MCPRQTAWENEERVGSRGPKPFHFPNMYLQVNRFIALRPQHAHLQNGSKAMALMGSLRVKPLSQSLVHRKCSPKGRLGKDDHTSLWFLQGSVQSSQQILSKGLGILRAHSHLPNINNCSIFFMSCFALVFPFKR